MRDIIAMVLAGGRVEDMSVLTALRPKAALTFAGQYRIIDFALSGLMDADLERVGVVSLYRPSSLIDHLGSGEPWDFIGRGRGAKVLPPYLGQSSGKWYRGTTDAIWHNTNFITDHDPEHVLILSGDHVYNLNFAEMIAEHRDTKADLTMAVKDMEPSMGRGRYGFAQVDEANRVVGYEEKPQEPKSRLASLTVYLFRTKVLLELLEKGLTEFSTYQLYSDVIPVAIAQYDVRAYTYDGYWNYSRSVDEYHEAHKDLLGDDPLIDLEHWPIRTRKVLRGLGDMPPARFGEHASCDDCIICPGASIFGSVTSSVLSPGVCVEQGAVVTNSVLWDNVVVRKDAVIDGVVMDRSVEVGRGALVGSGDILGPNRTSPHALSSGVTVVGKNTHIPPNAIIGRNCILHPNLSQDDFRGGEKKRQVMLSSGGTLGGNHGGDA